MLDRIRVAGAGLSGVVELWSFPRNGIFACCSWGVMGLNRPSTGCVFKLGSGSVGGGGAAGKRNSGMGFGDVRGDLRGPPKLGVFGAVEAPGNLPNRSGG